MAGKVGVPSAHLGTGWGGEVAGPGAQLSAQRPQSPPRARRAPGGPALRPAVSSARAFPAGLRKPA